MGNTHGGGSGSWRGEHVTSYQHASRPKLDTTNTPFDHHGTVVHTKEGNSYLIHSGLKDGVVTTPASNMSKNWSKEPSVHVSGKSTVQDAMNAAGGRTLDKTINYVTSGTCIGSSARVESHLDKKK